MNDDITSDFHQRLFHLSVRWSLRKINRFLTKIKKGDLTSEFYLPLAIDAGIKSGKTLFLRVFPASCLSWMAIGLTSTRKIN